jgi:hypothetical protein
MATEDLVNARRERFFALSPHVISCEHSQE